MKAIIISLTLIIFSLSACNNIQKLNSEVANIAEFQDSTITIKVKLHKFMSDDAETNKHCEAYNSVIATKFNDDIDSLKKHTNEYIAWCIANGIDRDFTSELNVTDSVYLSNASYISTLCISYVFEGGAHGTTKFQSLNYDIKRGKFIEKDDVIDFSKYETINPLLAKYLKNDDKCFNVAPNIEKCTAINFDDVNIYVTFEHYILGPYACGYTTITIPRNEIKKVLLID